MICRCSCGILSSGAAERGGEGGGVDGAFEEAGGGVGGLIGV